MATPPFSLLRTRLNKKIPWAEEFTAFCQAYFPAAAKQFTAGMSRMERETLLFSVAGDDPRDIHRALEEWLTNHQERPPRQIRLRWQSIALIVAAVVLLSGSYLAVRVWHARKNGEVQPKPSRAAAAPDPKQLPADRTVPAATPAPASITVHVSGAGTSQIVGPGATGKQNVNHFHSPTQVQSDLPSRMHKSY